MKRNRFDRINDRMLARIERVTDRMTREFKDTNPFDKELVSDDEKIQRYDNTTQEQWMGLMTTHTPADVEEYKNSMEDLKRRKRYA